MMLHEMKKNRYLEFKAELDALKEKNKDISFEKAHRRIQKLGAEQGSCYLVWGTN